MAMMLAAIAVTVALAVRSGALLPASSTASPAGPASPGVAAIADGNTTDGLGPTLHC